jgi:hypothetical protein
VGRLIAMLPAEGAAAIATLHCPYYPCLSWASNQQVRQLTDLAVQERAPLALTLRAAPRATWGSRRSAGGGPWNTSSSGPAVLAGERDRGVHLDHGQPPAGRDDRITLRFTQDRCA